MEGDGYSVPAEDQAMHFQTAVQTMAAQAGVGFQSVGRVSQGTNQFFLKLSEPVTLTAKRTRSSIFFTTWARAPRLSACAIWPYARTRRVKT